MKKILLMALCLMFVTSFGFGATSGVATWNVTVKPGLGIVVSPDSFDLGILTMGEEVEVLQPSVLLPVVTNDGASNCKYQLVLDKMTTGWTFAGINGGGTEEAGLGFILRDVGITTPVVFDSNRDKLENGPGRICDGIYFLGGGYDIAPAQSQAMEFRFGAPGVTANTSPTSFSVTLTALAM